MNRPPAHDVVVELQLETQEAGPKRVTSLVSRRAALSSPAEQLALLREVGGASGDFGAALQAAGHESFGPSRLEILQVNLGKLCNMSCGHCHVDAGPDRVVENMDRETVELCLEVLERSGAHTLDVTGGAPELNPHFRHLVEEAAQGGRHVIDRCNLTVLLLPRFSDLPGWLGERGVEIVCSLPHHRRLNTDAQRGDGAYEKSIRALRLLNAAGYGQGDPRRRLTLMSNPAGAFLSGRQSEMEAEWRQSLERRHGVVFDRLIALNNMPISRFLDWLASSGNLEAYMRRLTTAFNPATVDSLMCRNTLSVSWDGRLFDCDFNQMLELECRPGQGRRSHLRDFDPELWADRRIVTDRHCFGCTAGSGSSCGGSLEVS